MRLGERPLAIQQLAEQRAGLQEFQGLVGSLASAPGLVTSPLHHWSSVMRMPSMPSQIRPIYMPILDVCEPVVVHVRIHEGPSLLPNLPWGTW